MTFADALSRCYNISHHGAGIPSAGGSL